MCIRDRFTNKGFQNYVIKPGDEIRIMYTSTGRGADLGGDWGSKMCIRDRGAA